jgi:hypothetical protein
MFLIHLFLALERYQAQESGDWVGDKRSMKALGRDYKVPYSTLRKRCLGLVKGFGTARQFEPRVLSKEVEGEKRANESPIQ